MITDAAVSLSWFRMQLSDDPDDWVWCRTYWCQDGAEPLPLWEAYGNPSLDTPNGQVFDGPQFQFAPRKVRRKRFLAGEVENVTERPTVYARSAVSPFPGLHWIGEPEWFADGLPLSARGGEGPPGHCGADQWDSEFTIGLAIEGTMGQILGAGGAGLGGTSPVYTGYEAGLGGAGLGGTSPASSPIAGAGGAGLGGTSPVFPGYVTGAGGAGLGGTSGIGGSIVSSGGLGMGGISPLTCRDGDFPAYVGGTPQSLFSDNVTLDLPVGAADGDTVIIFALGEMTADQDILGPLGFVPFLNVMLPGGDDRAKCWYKHFSIDPIPASVTLTTDGEGTFSAALFVVRGASVTSGDDFGTGTTPPAVLPFATVHDRCALVVRALFNGPAFGPAFGLTDYTPWTDQSPLVGLGAWYREGVPPQDLPAVNVAYDNEDDWAAITMVFYNTIAP